MDDQTTAALVEMMNAVNAGDAARYARVYGNDAVITVYGGGELVGRSAIEEHEVELLREFPGARLAFRSIWQGAQRTVVHYAVNGQTSAGRWMGHEGLLFYRFDPEGFIQEEHRYLDSVTPMAQLGLLGDVSARALPILPTQPSQYLAATPSIERANVASVKATVAALDARNEPEFLASIAADAVVDEMIYPQPFVGKPRVKDWFDTWTTAVHDASTEITTILGVGDFVLAEMVVGGTLEGTLGIVSGANRRFEVHRAAIVRVSDGLLTQVSWFMNTKELAEAVGQRLSPR
jgi:ketosteroid isomerase-like protein